MSCCLAVTPLVWIEWLYCFGDGNAITTSLGMQWYLGLEGRGLQVRALHHLQTARGQCDCHRWVQDWFPVSQFVCWQTSGSYTRPPGLHQYFTRITDNTFQSSVKNVLRCVKVNLVKNFLTWNNKHSHFFRRQGHGWRLFSSCTRAEWAAYLSLRQFSRQLNRHSVVCVLYF